MTFIVDSREKQETFDLCKTMGIPAKRMKLEVGDFMSERMCVERKAVNDLYGSVLSQRLSDQLRRFNDYCETHGLIKFLLVEGNVDTFTKSLPEGMDFRVNTDVIYGTMASAIVRDQMNLIWVLPASGSSKESMTKEAIKLMYKVSQKIDEDKWGLQRRISLPHGPAMKVAHVASALRISMTLASRLLKKFGSLRNILLAKDSDLLVIPGIGQATLQRIKRLLD